MQISLPLGFRRRDNRRERAQRDGEYHHYVSNDRFEVYSGYYRQLALLGVTTSSHLALGTDRHRMHCMPLLGNFASQTRRERWERDSFSGGSATRRFAR